MHRAKQDEERRERCLRFEKLMNNCKPLEKPKEIFEAVRAERVADLAEGNKDFFTLREENYAEPLRALLHAEEIHESIEMRKFDQFGGRIVKLHEFELGIFKCLSNWFKVHLRGVSKKHPSLIGGDYVVLEKFGKYQVCEIVKIIQGDQVIFELPEDSEFYKSFGFRSCLKFNVSFVSSGFVFALCRKALSSLSDVNVSLFESSTADHNDRNISPIESMISKSTSVEASAYEVLDERLSLCNERQKQAITAIMEARCRPKPYILFGPPGTGKTRTLVEAIVQIHIRNPRLNLLVCANSNNCADQLTQSINETKLVHSVMRFSCASHLESKKRIALKNATDESRELRERDPRIIVTTNIKAGTLKDWLFDYVFIDEVGHAHEPESLVPIVKKTRDGCVVLAGDPKQLGPVIKCEEVGRLGLDQSILERLFKLEAYKRNESHESNYDRNFITKLVISYRCDPRILELCNRLFYDGELSCRGECPESLLKQMNFSHPLVFCSIRGNECRQKYSTSRYNDAEIDVCVNLAIKFYKMGYKPHQIGVISPYKLQKDRIKRNLHSSLDGGVAAELNQRFPGDAELKVDRKDEAVLQEAQSSSPEKNGTAQSDTGEDSDTSVGILETNKPQNGKISHLSEELLGEMLENLSLVEDESPLEDQSDSLELSESDTIDRSVAGDSNHKRGRGVINVSNGQKNGNSNRANETRSKPTKSWMCQVDTVDAFQGQEREIIIISTVRTPNGFRSIHQCGFLADSKRFNVAISRAKWLVIVVGHPAVIECHKNWRLFGESAERVDPEDLKVTSSSDLSS